MKRTSSRLRVLSNLGEGLEKASKIHAARARNSKDTRRMGHSRVACLPSFACVRVFRPASYPSSKLETTPGQNQHQHIDVDYYDDDCESATNDEDMIEHVSNNCRN